MDLRTGVTSTGDLDVLSDARGEAQAVLILGKRTDAIPRFVQLDGDEFATQVGVNLVTVRSGNASLPEPFTSIAFPDEQFDGQNRKATISLLSDPFVDGLSTSGGGPHRRECPRPVRQPVVELAGDLQGPDATGPGNAARGLEPVRRPHDDSRLRPQDGGLRGVLEAVREPGLGRLRGRIAFRRRRFLEPRSLRLRRWSATAPTAPTSSTSRAAGHPIVCPSGTGRLATCATARFSRTAATPCARTCSWPRAAAPCA